LGQPETNLRGQINALSVVGERLEESPAMVLQETVSVLDSTRIERRKDEESLSSNGRSSITPPAARPYQPSVPYPQRVAWAKLSELEPRFVRFLDILRRAYADVSFMEALKKAQTYMKFLRELLFKKGDNGDALIAPIGEACSAILENRSPAKLQDPSSFSVPCCIGDVQIERALGGLGANVSLIPLSLCARSLSCWT